MEDVRKDVERWRKYELVPDWGERFDGTPLPICLGQEGEVSNYDTGDTLLIDDVSISAAE